MTDFTVIRLDTTAPIVTWGDATGAVASEDMTVPYLLNELGIEHAEIELRDGRVLAMVDTGAALTVTLPDDTPEGNGTIRAYVVDDVGNRATRTVVVALSGVIPVDRPLPQGQGYPQAPVVTKISFAPSVARTSSTTAVSVTTSTTGRARTRSTYVPLGRQMVRYRDRASVSATWTLSARLQSEDSAATGRAQDTVTKRPEGPGAEEDLILLGLL